MNALLIEEKAAAWLARRDAGNWSDTDQQALDAWIAEDMAHRVAWLRLESAWRRADRMADKAEAERLTLAKGRRVVDEQGDSMFA